MSDLFKLLLGILASRFKARATLEAEEAGPAARPILGGLHHQYCRI
jgi:hypothetical protein